MNEPKRDEFDAIRAKIAEINLLFGGKTVIKEWTSGGEKVLKVVLQWDTKTQAVLA